MFLKSTEIVLVAFFGILGKDNAYLDPGSGSFIIQLIIASLLGAALVVRTSWSRIKSFFKRDSDQDDVELDEHDRNEE